MLSLSQAEDLHKLYMSGTKFKQLTEIAQCSRSHIKRAFSFYGLPSKPTGNPPSITREKIFELYDEYATGLSLSALSKAHQVNVASIFRGFKKYGLQTRLSSNDFRCVDEHCFDELTPESLYWIGFLMADGWVNCRDVIGIGVNTVDFKHIEKFRGFVKGNQNILVHPKRNFCYFQFRSTYVSQVLAAYGVTKNKSLTASPSSEVGISRDFWRGMIDGDGSLCVSTRYRQRILSFAGSYCCVKGFYDFCTQFIGTPNGRVRQEGSIFVVRFTSGYACQVSRFLYENTEEGQRLDRKYTLYKESFVQ